MSQAGYKLHKHIAGTLQARSHTIRTALERYNQAAAALSPSRPLLSWNEVVEYTFLADFDPLWDSRQDIRERPWSKSVYQVLMDWFFKTKCAREEIHHLNIEIPGVTMYVRDKDEHLQKCEVEVGEVDPSLAHQIGTHCCVWGRFNNSHLRQFHKLVVNPSFTGTTMPGTTLVRLANEGTGQPTNTDPADVP